MADDWSRQESGVVTLAFSRWDHHGDNFGALRQGSPCWIRDLSALIQDLQDRRV